MTAMPIVHVQINQNGTGTVSVGDVDISHAVLGVDVTARPMGGTEVLLRTRAVVEVEAYGRVDQQTAAALIELGWMPPDNPGGGVASSGNQR